MANGRHVSAETRGSRDLARGLRNLALLAVVVAFLVVLAANMNH